MNRATAIQRERRMPSSIKSEPDRASGSFARLRSTDLVAETVTQLRSQILAGRYGTDGELPTEAELSRKFGVSRTVAREAMRTLRAQGLVVVSRGRRPRVKPFDSEVVTDSLQVLLLRSQGTLLHLGEIRRPLEVEIAGLAAERATDADIAAMQESIEAQSAARTVKKQVASDRKFHELLAASTENPLFQLFLSTIATLINESRHRTISRVGPDRAIEGHVAILAAVRQRDVPAARAAMRLHLRMAEEDLAEKRG